MHCGLEKIITLTDGVSGLQVLLTGKDKVEDPELQPYIKNGSIELRLNHIEWRDFLKLIEQSRCDSSARWAEILWKIFPRLHSLMKCRTCCYCLLKVAKDTGWNKNMHVRCLG